MHGPVDPYDVKVWGPCAPWTGLCGQTAVISLGRVSPGWSRGLDREFRAVGIPHWRNASDTHLSQFPRLAVAFLLIRHVAADESLWQLCQETQTLCRIEHGAVLVVLPAKIDRWQWLLRECGALEVWSDALHNVPRMARFSQRYLARFASTEPTVPACWLTPPEES